MGSTGEPDRKRRHFSSLSSPTAAMAKKQPFSQWSEDKKLDAAVLQYQNQKLVQKLETQKVEYSALESKLSQLKQKQEPYGLTLKAVNRSWEVLITDLETCSIGTRDLSSKQDLGYTSVQRDDSSSLKDALLSRLEETGATDTSCMSNCCDQMEEDRDSGTERTRNILCNVESVINDRWLVKDALHASCLKELPEDGDCKKNESCKLVEEVKSLRSAVNDLRLKHKSVARQLQNHQDADAKNKAQLKRLKGELENVVAELEDCNCKLATLKAEKDATKGAFFPVINIGSKHSAADKARDKQKDLQEMESTLKELLGQASSQLLELKGLHDERINILQQLSYLQNSLKSVKSIAASSPYLLVRDRLEKSKSEVLQYQASYEKLQIEKDNHLWREKELNVKNDLLDVFRRSSSVMDSKIGDLRMEIQKQTNERNMIETKLGDASKEAGRKEIIADFKALLSSFPEEMGIMQRQLSDFKEAASDIHSLRADAQSLSAILDRKAKECKNLSSQSANQYIEIQKLHSSIQDLKQSDLELKLILEMYRRESTDPSCRDVMEAKDMEYKAWAQVQSLKSSLDEQTLELRVKTANEAEAISQQRLAAAEAEIVELRHNLEASKRGMSGFSDSLKSKNEENEAFLSEIETIGQAYDDMQTQNQHLLQQITERDDYNIKLVLEGVKARQLRDSLLIEKRITERDMQQANISFEFFDVKAARIEDQLRVCRDQVHKLVEDKLQNSVAAENTRKRLIDVRKSSDQARETLENSQSKLESSRAAFSDMRIELERERFERRRIEENLEASKRKIIFLKAQTENSPILEKLREELREYREIVKCSICLDRPKEVVITKCYHLFCSPCIQKIIGTRHRKCPSCAASFGSNDVKPVYI